MEEAQIKQSLKKRYLRHKTVNIPYLGSQEDLRLKFKSNVEEISAATTENIPEKRNSLQLSYTEGDKEQHKFAILVDTLKIELEQEKGKVSDQQKEIQLLHKNLAFQEDIIKKQDHQISSLNNTLSERSEKLKQAEDNLQKLLEEQHQKLLDLEDTSKQGQELKQALINSESKLKEVLIALEKQRTENAKYVEKNTYLENSLEKASSIGKELEKCLSEEAAKTLKVQEELEFVIQNINSEKEKLLRDFEKFKVATGTFFTVQDTERDIILKLIQTESSS